MKYEITSNGNLRITCTQEERADIITPESDAFLYEGECLEWLIANSELDWVPDGVTDDLTSAPMLGVWGEEGRAGSDFPHNYGLRLSSQLNGEPWFQPLLQRWCYMDYQVRSFTEDLKENGECIFTK